MEAPPPYSPNPGLMNHGIQRNNYSGRASPLQMNIILQPTVPPGGIEAPIANTNDLVNFLTSKQGQNTKVVIVSNGAAPGSSSPCAPPYQQQPPQMPPVQSQLNFGIMRNSCQTPNGGRYVVNQNTGVIEHLSAEEYKRRQMMTFGIVTVMLVVFLIIFIIVISQMHKR